jgi:capsular polysaccharide biosynthesis protein
MTTAGEVAAEMAKQVANEVAKQVAAEVANQVALKVAKQVAKEVEVASFTVVKRVAAAVELTMVKGEAEHAAMSGRKDAQQAARRISR